MSVVKTFVANIISKKEISTNWEEFMGIKTSHEQTLIYHEIVREINKNGIYSIFVASNSKEEVKKRIDAKRNEKWKSVEVALSGIAVLILIAQLYLLANPSK